MRATIKALEQAAKKLEPMDEQRGHWNQQVQQYADQFIGQIDTLKAYEEFTTHPAALPAIPETPRPIEQLLQVLKEQVDGIGLNPASGGHLGYVPGGGVFPTALGDYLAAVTNRYAGIYYGGPGAVRLENQLLRWLCSIVGYPDTALGNLTSGGSIANLIAITTARDHLDIQGARVSRAVIYLTEQVHHCVQKALRIAGLGSSVIRYIEVDERYRMDAGALEQQIIADQQEGLIPFLLVGSAGTTDVGAIDPMNQLADLAETHGMWFHVDAAYGGFFILLEEMKPAFKGMERSDSLAIDPHKGLFLSYGLGAVLIKNVEAQFNSHFYKANYMQDAHQNPGELSPADLSPELTKHFRGLRMWLPLQLYGLAPFRSALEEKVMLCRYFYKEVQRIGFEVGPEPELSIMIFRYLPEQEPIDDFNQQLVAEVRKDGRVFLSSTTIRGVFWIRLAVLSFRTHLSTIDMCLEVLKEKVRQLEATLGR
jgi:glutamate/tyrosine decarboxylase-like PLP-dependent enzyme